MPIKSSNDRDLLSPTILVMIAISLILSLISPFVLYYFTSLDEGQVIQISIAIGTILFSAVLAIAYYALYQTQKDQTNILEDQIKIINNQEKREKQRGQPEIVIEDWDTETARFIVELSNIGGGMAKNFEFSLEFNPFLEYDNYDQMTDDYSSKALEESSLIPRDITLVDFEAEKDRPWNDGSDFQTLVRGDIEGGSNVLARHEKSVDYEIDYRFPVFNQLNKHPSFEEIVSYLNEHDADKILFRFYIRYLNVDKDTTETIFTRSYVVDVKSDLTLENLPERHKKFNFDDYMYPNASITDSLSRV